jgi:glycolate oxidase
MSTTATLPPVAHPPGSPDHAKLVARMRQIVGADNVLTSAADMAVYECDGFTIAKTKPDVVVFPTSTGHIVEIVKACNAMGVGFLARGAGTSLAPS